MEIELAHVIDSLPDMVWVVLVLHSARSACRRCRRWLRTPK